MSNVSLVEKKNGAVQQTNAELVEKALLMLQNNIAETELCHAL